MTKLTAAIAGAGIGGLTTGIALLKKGWDVHLFEQGPEIRILGAGIYVWENGLKVLEKLGISDRVIGGSVQVRRRERRDAKGDLFGVEDTYLSGRVYVPLRKALLTALRDEFLACGGHVTFGREVAGATADGTLHFATGNSQRADLVVGADGINSKVRDSLNLLKWRKAANQFGYRAMIRREEWEQHDAGRSAVCEHWNRGRRLLYAPSTPELVYVQLTSLRGDAAAGGEFDRASWLRTFPHLQWIIDRIPENGRGDWFETVRLKQWSSGRVVLIGDSASAQPPFLGQGGGVAMTSALSLAHSVSKPQGIDAGIREWEGNERSFVEWVQSVSRWYGNMAYLPQPVRRQALATIAGTAWIRERTIRCAAVRQPIGLA